MYCYFLCHNNACFLPFSFRIRGDFNDGVRVGQQIAEDFWVANGSDCGYIFSFEGDVDD